MSFYGIFSIFPDSNCISDQGFGREKDGNHGKFIGFNLVIFCYKIKISNAILVNDKTKSIYILLKYDLFKKRSFS